MSDAKRHILERLRQANAAPIEVLNREQIAIHDWGVEECIHRFTERMRAVRAQVHRCDNESWVSVLSQICDEKDIASLLYAPESPWGDSIKQQAETDSAFPELLLYDQDIEAWKHDLFYACDASLTSTLGGIAETGTLILWATPDEPRLMSLVPPIHIAILEVEKLYTTFAEAMREQNWAAQMPTNALLISGPSKSADIEQTLAYGVHGPKELVVLLV